jgi:hypothetical protein
MKPATTVTVFFLVAIGILHVVRLVSGVPVTVDELAIPMWPSVFAALVSLGLALGVWREHRSQGPAGGHAAS